MSLSCFPILVLILCAAALPAAIFEVDQLRGNDGNPGSSAQPLATIAAAQAKLANPGDVVLIRAGRYFVHAWKVNVAGAAGNPITYRAAPGETVIIDFGLQVSGAWRADGGGLWSAPFSGDSGRVVIDGRALVLAAAGTTPSAGSFQVANGRLALFPPAGVRAPDSAEVVILNPTYPASSADCSLHVTANHIALERLILQGGSWGIYGGNWGAAKSQYRDLTIADCEIRFMTTYALCLWGWENCTMSRCSVHGVNQLNWPRGSSSTWGHAIIGWNSSNVTIEDCQVFANHGEGIGPFLGCRDWRIRRNTVYDNYSVNIYIDTDEDDAAMVVDRNLIYVTGTIGNPADIRNFPDGIRVTNEGACDYYLPYQDQTPVVSNVTITNNLVINCGSNGGITSFQYQDIGYVLDRSLIAGNTVVRSHGNTAGISIQAATNTTLANNLVYPALTYLPGSGLASSGNLFTDSAPFTVGTGIDPANYRPVAGSPAIGGGTTLAALSTDFFGAARSSPPDIGACQHLALNAAPSVSAGPDRSITLPATASLDGTVTNDGLPVGAAVTSTWGKISGPGTVTFGNTAAVDTTAAFSVAGTYVLRLTSSDSLLSASDDMQVVVVNAAPAPVVVAIISPVDGVDLVPGVSVGIQASASGGAGISSVSFLVNGGVIGSDSTPGDGWSQTWAAPIQGTHVLAARATDANGLVGSALPVIVPLGQTGNLIGDPGFERGGSGWSIYGAASVSSSARSGILSAGTSAVSSGVYRSITGLQAGRTYRLSGWGRISASGVTAYLYVKNFGGNEIAAAITSTSSWQGLSSTFTVAAGYSGCEIGLWQSAGSGTATLDDVMLVPEVATPVNVAPSVSAGPDRTITLPATASLDGTVTNDGLPVGAAVTSTWSKVSGPGTVTFGNTAAVDTTAAFSVTGTFVLRLTASDTLLSASDEVQVVVNAAPAIPAGWSSQDLGTATPAGSALGDGVDWTIRGGGPDIWNQADGARFAWQIVTGDGDLVVRVVSQTNTNAWARAGLMIRESSAAGSRHISLLVTPGNGVSLQHRAKINGSSSSLAGPKVAAPTWLKLTRRGSVFTGWQSTNGTTWTLVGSRTVAIPASALVGMAVSSRTTTTLSTAVFAGFSALPMANN